LFIATGSSLIFVHYHWEFPRLDVCRVKKYHTIYQGKPGKAFAPKLLKLYLSDFRSVLGAALQQKVALIFWLQFFLCS
jgi:hypothetical protein